MLAGRQRTLGHDTRALLVVHNGNIVAEAYAPGYTERSLFLGWSMAKSITGLMIGQLEMQGKLEVTETGLFPQWQDGRSNISIEQLLHMTDGLAYDEIYDPGATAPAMLFQHPSAAAYMLSLPLRDEPGPPLPLFLRQHRLAEPAGATTHRRQQCRSSRTFSRTFFPPAGHATYGVRNRRRRFINGQFVFIRHRPRLGQSRAVNAEWR